MCLKDNYCKNSHVSRENLKDISNLCLQYRRVKFNFLENKILHSYFTILYFEQLISHKERKIYNFPLFITMYYTGAPFISRLSFVVSACLLQLLPTVLSSFLHHKFWLVTNYNQHQEPRPENSLIMKNKPKLNQTFT